MLQDESTGSLLSSGFKAVGRVLIERENMTKCIQNSDELRRLLFKHDDLKITIQSDDQLMLMFLTCINILICDHNLEQKTNRNE